MAYLDITNDLTKKGIKELKIGQILMFTYEGSPNYIKIMKKEKGRVWAKRLDPERYLTPEEADDKVEVVTKDKLE